MRTLHAAIALLTFLATGLSAQDKGLVVRPDPEFAVAKSLLGQWQVDAASCRRLGTPASNQAISFRAGEGIVERIPAKIVAEMQEMQLRIYLQGTMVREGAEHPFVLTVVHGNPMVVWFRERAGDPLGDSESLLVAVARGVDAAHDLLLVGGDRPDEPMTAFARQAGATAPLTPQAVVTQMSQLLEAGKGREFVETYCAPDDLQRLLDRGRTMDDLAERFTGERKQQLITLLLDMSKREPTWNEARDQVSWANTSGEGPSELKLKLVDGRWYIKDR